ncbi:hypothetical protein BD309DRAFT_873375, partial [Dichomitus squalens]
ARWRDGSRRKTNTATDLYAAGEDRLAPADVFRYTPLLPKRAGTPATAEHPHVGRSHARPTTWDHGSGLATRAAGACTVAFCVLEGSLLDDVWKRSLRRYQPRYHDLVRRYVRGGGRRAARYWRPAKSVESLH